MAKMIDIKRCAGAFLLAAGLATAFAIPAKQGVLTFTQPDGTTVKVTLHGDESFHYYLSADGYPLMAGEDGTLCFASMENGMPVASDYKACDVSVRSAALRQWLSNAPGEQDFVRSLKAEAAKANAPRRIIPQSGIGLSSTEFPKSGKVKGLVILVQYSNVKFRLDDPKTYFTNLLNQPGFSDYRGTGSARDYYMDASNGQFEPEFDVYGPVTLPYKRSYYGASTAYSHDSRPEDMVVHAIELLDPEVDFSQYDNDKDGKLDNVYLFYAGQGENDGGPSECIWPHAWELTAQRKEFLADGVLVSRYACSNEWQTQAGLPDGIGTFCHEFSHVMGLPDLYCTNGMVKDGYTPGKWSIMDYGPYNNDSRTPPTYSAYERNAMGWLDIDVLGEAATVTLPELQSSNKGCLMPTRNTNEFFLFENRQQTKWDTYLPGHGMLIWHIDFDQRTWDLNEVNNSQTHQYVDLVEANGAGNSDTGAAWPGTTGKTNFTADSNPAFRNWYGEEMPPITNIEETDGVITFDVDGGDFVFGTPEAPMAEDVTPVSFRLSWNAVDRAKSYEVSVYTKDEGGSPIYLDGFNALNVDGETSVAVENLVAETDYYAVYRAVNGSRRSELYPEMHVRTPELTFPYFTPEVMPATDVTDTSFTANWKPMDGAASYILTVASSTEVAPHDNTCSFGSMTFMLPRGWEFSENTSRYEDKEYCGKAVPSAKMTVDGSCITTKAYDYDVLGISFWYKGVKVNTQSCLEVEGLANGEWVSLMSVTSLSREATTVDIRDIPQGVRQVRFIFRSYGTGEIAMDDIVISVGGNAQVNVPGYEGLDVGNVTSWKVDNLPAGLTDFVYMVQAVDQSGVKSLVSKGQEVKLDNSSVTDIDAGRVCAVSVTGDCITLQGEPYAPVLVYSPDGRLAAAVTLDAEGIGRIRVAASGIYIARFANRSFKIMVHN